MKKYLLSILLIVLLFTGCNKETVRLTDEQKKQVEEDKTICEPLVEKAYNLYKSHITDKITKGVCVYSRNNNQIMIDFKINDKLLYLYNYETSTDSFDEVRTSLDDYCSTSNPSDLEKRLCESTKRNLNELNKVIDERTKNGSIPGIYVIDVSKLK